jgi:hypothetical protein
MEIGKGLFQPFLVPPGITLGTEKIGPHIIIDAMNFPILFRKEAHYFTADESTGPRYDHFSHSSTPYTFPPPRHEGTKFYMKYF